MGKNLTTLPKNGTRDRDLLADEAIRIGLDALSGEELNIQTPLSAAHMRTRQLLPPQGRPAATQGIVQRASRAT